MTKPTELHFPTEKSAAYFSRWLDKNEKGGVQTKSLKGCVLTILESDPTLWRRFFDHLFNYMGRYYWVFKKDNTALQCHKFVMRRPTDEEKKKVKTEKANAELDEYSAQCRRDKVMRGYREGPRNAGIFNRSRPVGGDIRTR